MGFICQVCFSDKHKKASAQTEQHRLYVTYVIY
ncbi:hypothetical protein YPC_3447 [Yersinia pestis biovar Medievalis str. Harbin 35]|nr:hypothetical protein YPC_3447 [Yersinia pestis biovar Medievalis str. Harbin 35]EEO77344.1 hypothetical protein YP516_1005 [Yersinia pestis Nepal516]EEO79810.1 hypothetical protein YPF_3805 [Yersinia pestis biovar Orientalis str. India 195]EEO85180.1 hypothetical protein YPH_1022 [Yersinia pestis biovar Orientalis str. PEXU2]EEO89031.1 hypothetical protein YPS_3890 [Yersinia pestis Pestoides A]